MPLIHHRALKSVSIRVWNIEETESELWAIFGSWPDFEREMVSVKSMQRRLERLATQVLLKQHFGEIVPVSYNSDGKPILTNGFYLSISHAGPYVAIMVSPSHEVAIDLEQLNPQAKTGESRIVRVAHKFINQAENDFIKPYSPAEQEWLQTVIWSAKEVLFKLYSKGGVDFKEHLHVMPFQPEVCTVLDGRIHKHDLQANFRLQVEHHPHWMMVFGSDAERID